MKTLLLSKKLHYALILICISAWGPFYRAVLDKLWMVNGDLHTVGYWAQLQTMLEFIGAPVISGIAIGLTILAAQQEKAHHQIILISGYLLSLLIILPFLLLTIIFSETVCQWIGLSSEYKQDFILSTIAGYLSIGIALLNSLLIGKNQQGKALLLAFFCGTPAILTLTICVFFNASQPITWVLCSIICIGLSINILIIFLSIKLINNGNFDVSMFRKTCHQLLRFIPAGLSIGILSPLCVLLARSVIASQQSWENAGMATAIWRISDWILSSAVTILYFHYLPMLSAASSKGSIKASVMRVMLDVGIPSFIGLLLLLIFRNEILHILYSPTTDVTFSTAFLFWSGEVARILSAVFLMGLFVLHATKIIAIWDFFSQPLFVLLLLLGMSKSLELTGLAYLLTYLLYATLCITAFLYIDRNQFHKATLSK